MTRAEAQERARRSFKPTRIYKQRDRNSAEVLEYRVKMLPVQLERARARVAQLEREAASLGFTDLLEVRA